MITILTIGVAVTIASYIFITSRFYKLRHEHIDDILRPFHPISPFRQGII